MYESGFEAVGSRIFTNSENPRMYSLVYDASASAPEKATLIS
jgi:hypothetical protein